MTNTNIITTNNLCKNYGVGDNAVRALKNCNIEIHTGESVAVTGASGSGKSTFLTLVGGITTASNGEIVINGKNITSMSEKELAKLRLENIGFVFQAYNLIPEMTAYQNIILPLKLAHKKIDKKYLSDICNKLSISDRLSHLPSELSGGQQQRVAIARALVSEAPIILADEPTGALDSASAKQLLSMLAELNEQDRSTILMVTHDPFSASFGNRVLFIKDGNLKKEIDKGQHNRNDFYQTILSEISAFGGE